MGFLGRGSSDSGDDAVGLLVRAVDTTQEWHLLLTADGRELGSGRGPGDAASVRCTMTGPASGLYLTLWNRCDPDAAAVRVEGDAAVLAAWPEAMRITWA